jgi:hypothetical protein
MAEEMCPASERPIAKAQLALGGVEEKIGKLVPDPGQPAHGAARADRQFDESVSGIAIGKELDGHKVFLSMA